LRRVVCFKTKSSDIKVLISLDLKLLFNTVGIIKRNVGETPVKKTTFYNE
jgi:hypothetical protein